MQRAKSKLAAAQQKKTASTPVSKQATPAKRQRESAPADHEQGKAPAAKQAKTIDTQQQEQSKQQSEKKLLHPLLQYLKTWKDDYKNWKRKTNNDTKLIRKFDKASVVPEPFFKIFLEYAATIKGNARTVRDCLFTIVIILIILTFLFYLY